MPMVEKVFSKVSSTASSLYVCYVSYSLFSGRRMATLLVQVTRRVTV